MSALEVGGYIAAGFIVGTLAFLWLLSRINDDKLARMTAPELNDAICACHVAGESPHEYVAELARRGSMDRGVL